MIIAFDNTFLSLVLNPDTPPTLNPATKKPVDHCAQRVEALVDSLSNRGDTVLIPTPCFSELLCGVPDLASITRQAIKDDDKKSGTIIGWQEIKFDRQIAIIAKVSGAEKLGLNVRHTWDLDLPSKYAQDEMFDNK